MSQLKVVFKFIRNLNNMMLVLCAAVLVVCFVSTSESLIPDTPTEIITPCTIADLKDGSKEYFFNLSDYDSRYSSLMFYSSHQIVKAYHGGDEIYAFDKTGGIWGSTPGSEYNFIPINEKMHHVVVTITPVYDSFEYNPPIFFIGSTYQIYDDLLKKSIPKFVVSLLIIMFSFVIFVYYVFMNKKLKLSKELVYLGYFSLFVGTWSLNETDVTVLIFDNKVYDALIPYVCLLFIIPPFVLFFDMYLGINGKGLKRGIIIASMVEFVVCVLLHFTKIVEFREQLLYMQIMLLIAGIYVVGTVILQLLKKDFSRQTKICAVGVFLFLISFIVDVINYYKYSGDSDVISRYFFLAFMLMLAWDLIKGTNEVIEKGRHAKQLEAFALTDSMTGLLNRNAFESHMRTESEKSLDGLMAIVADANGLKACNDTYGHEAGDEYITTVAKIFNHVYGRYGNCYRTGGDEFCCIIPPNNNINLDRLEKLFMTKIYTANLEGKFKYVLGVAVGAAKYNPDLDEDFKALVKRADASMYENKRACKTS